LIDFVLIGVFALLSVVGFVLGVLYERRGWESAAKEFLGKEYDKPY
jgi:hypothetical protein